jgi:cobalamin biosynthesis protein CbiG
MISNASSKRQPSATRLRANSAVGEPAQRQRVDQPRAVRIAPGGDEPGDVAREQQIVIVEKRDPIASRHVEAGIGCLGPR